MLKKPSSIRMSKRTEKFHKRDDSRLSIKKEAEEIEMRVK
jgi:hypothetical protein